MKGKKGLIFILDVVIGMSILLIGVFLLMNFFYINPISDQPQDLSNQVLDYLLTTKIGEVSDFYLINLSLNNVIDPYHYISEEFAILCSAENNTFFKELANLTVGNIVPFQFNYSLAVINSSYTDSITYCLEPTVVYLEEPEIISVSTATIMSVNDTGLIGPYLIEVKIW